MSDQEITTVGKTPVAVGVRIRDLDEAFRAAKAIAMSGLCPYQLRGKPNDVLAIMLYGAELGLSIWQSVQGITVIKGRTSMSVELRVAKTRQAGHRVGVVCAAITAKDLDGNPLRCGEYPEHPCHTGTDDRGHPYLEDSTTERCRVKVVRGDNNQIVYGEFTLDDAERAGLLKRSPDGLLLARSEKNEPLPWEMYGRDMLYNRAAGRACRRGAPEVGFGSYTDDEINAMPDPVPVNAEYPEVVQPALTGDPIPVDDAATEAATLQREFEQA